MDKKYEKLLGFIIAETKPFDAEPGEPFVYLRPLLKKGFSEEELGGLVARLKKDGIAVKDSVVGDGEFDRVVEVSRDALLALVRKN